MRAEQEVREQLAIWIGALSRLKGGVDRPVVEAVVMALMWVLGSDVGEFKSLESHLAGLGEEFRKSGV